MGVKIKKNITNYIFFLLLVFFIAIMILPLKKIKANADATYQSVYFNYLYSEDDANGVIEEKNVQKTKSVKCGVSDKQSEMYFQYLNSHFFL